MTATARKAKFAKHSPVPSAPIVRPLTDMGNSERFVSRHGAALRYVPKWRQWLIWNGNRWVLDDVAAAERLAKETARAIYSEAAGATDQDERKRIARWAIQSESEKRISALLRLARSEPGVPVRTEELDSNPWVLPTGNVSIDLRLDNSVFPKIRPHDRDDLTTRWTAVAHDENAQCPTWIRFLDRVLPDSEVQRFVQKAAGSALTGITRDQVLFVFHGLGSNGKTTLMETLRSALGDFAVTTPVETLLVKYRETIPNDVARLRGARMVIASEPEHGRKLAEATVKALTGGDTISARFMRSEWFEFQPTFKLFLSTNHKPVIRGDDTAIWRRIRLIPFAVTIPPEEQDENLKDKLLTELPGVLQWLVAGCMLWQREGLGYPEAVKAATSSYRTEMDLVGGFLDDCVYVDGGAWVSSADL